MNYFTMTKLSKFSNICGRFKRFVSSTVHHENTSKIEPKNLRNIGISAHIDAGKTTTTERMLFYSGTIRNMGEVHHGNTVTDYMEQERQRGITITAAAVSFPWNDHQFNLIDTPGHIDFTMEVEQSLAVLDGAVVILDSSAGVEAQTLTVWRQCNTYNIPRIVYLNKMDRRDADVDMCLKSLKDKLEIQPLCLQFPIKDSKEQLRGLVDVVNMESIVYTNNRGTKFTQQKLTESHEFLWEKASILRRDIVDIMTEHDDNLANLVIKSESLDSIDSTSVKESIRKATIDLKVFPVVCGSSYKNIGVQMLMDNIIDYLPSPVERNNLYSCFNNELCAKAFKVQHDNQKGVLTYFRIYSGNISKNQKIYNISKEKSEQGGNLYIPYADEYESVQAIENGNVAVISGLNSTMTGDIITSSNSCATQAKKRLTASLNDKSAMNEFQIPTHIQNKILANEYNPEEAASTILGIGTSIPDPVFFCSIEPPSLAYQTSLETALNELQREDASLRVTYNSETGQTILAGMGELHLDIIKERIHREYKIEADLGPLQIAYKETIQNKCKESHHIESKIAGSNHIVDVTLSAYPLNEPRKHVLKMDTSHDSASNLAKIYNKYLQAVKLGVSSALVNGPKLGCPIVNVGVTLHWLEIGRFTSETVVAAAVTQCLRKIFKAADAIILEPIMSVEVVVPENYNSRILTDLTKRRASIQNVNTRGKNKIIQCFTPLSELLGYSTDLRSLSSGTAFFSMEFHCNQPMSLFEEEKAIKRIRGF